MLYVRGSVSNTVMKYFEGALSNIAIINGSCFSDNYHYDKRLNDFGLKVKEKYVKATIVVDNKSQIID